MTADEADHLRASRRVPALAGVRAIAPLSVAAFPFGLVYGVAVSQSDVDQWLGLAASFLILAGAAQLSLLELMFDASWVVAVGTALLINLRFMLYSAALAPSFSEYPSTAKYALPYLMTDQAASTALIEYKTHRDPFWRRWFYLGAGLSFAMAWWIGTAVGIGSGSAIPSSWQIQFAVPLMFIALLVPSVVNRPAFVAAVVGALVTVVSNGLPDGVNICLGGLCGVVAGSAFPTPEGNR